MPTSFPTSSYLASTWVVNPTAGKGSHTTIASALSSASSGDIILITPGLYTENLTLKAGVTLTSFSAGAASVSTNASSGLGNVRIKGKLTANDFGTNTAPACISGIWLETNGDYAVTITGTTATKVFISRCTLIGADFTILNNSNSNGRLNLIYCMGDLQTTGIAVFTISNGSNAGNIYMNYCKFSNSGGSSTANTAALGSYAFISYSLLAAITTSDTSGIDISFSDIRIATLNGTGSTSITNSSVTGLTSSAISVGAGATLTISNSEIFSSNTNAITGSGTINYSNLTFTSSSSNINTTTQSILKTGPSETIGSSNSGAANVLTVTNSSNTATSSAQLAISVAGSTADDPTSLWSTTTTNWIAGIDNSVTSPTADPWVLAQGTALGTNNVMSVATSGEINYPLQPAFMAFLSSDVTNVTGDGTNYTLACDTEVFDQNGDFNGTTTFTAPVTGRYHLNTNIRFEGYGAGNSAFIALGTSNRSYRFMENLLGTYGFAAGAGAGYVGTVLADMDAADTCTVTCNASGGTKTVGIGGSSILITSFSGYLEC